MADLPEPFAGLTGFEWDEGNAEKNWRSHRVTRAEAEQAFFHRPVVVAVDVGHSAREARYVLLGRTARDRLLCVVFTVRGPLVRVISARPMSRRERRIYGEALEAEGDPSV